MKNFALLVAWLLVPALLMAGVGAVVSDLFDWDLALGVGGSAIAIPQDRYVGVSFMVLAGALAAALHFGGRVLDFMKAHKLPFVAAGVLAALGLALFGSALVESLDGGPAVVAAMDGDTARLEALFEAGEVDESDYGRMLCWTAQRGHVDTLNLLLERGVNPDTPRDDGASAMSLACSYGGPAAVDALEAAGATADCG